MGGVSSERRGVGEEFFFILFFIFSFLSFFLSL